MKTDRFFEYATAQDRCLDFCLWEYEPLGPQQGKFRSVNLLLKSFEVAGLDSRTLEICRAIREGIGPFRTVWGIKQTDGGLSLEFYFYDYKRMERRVSIERLLDVLAPYVKCSLSFPDRRPYFMFSIDLDAALLAGHRELDEINVYIGNVGSNVSSGICYSLTEDGLTLDNFYFFFDAGSELEKAMEKALCSVHLDPLALDPRKIFWPELIRCQTVVIANKKFNDGIYFSRVDIDQLLLFLRRMDYPPELVSFAESNRRRLDHLRYDVAFDYVMDRGDLKILKSSFYGVF